MTEKIAIVVCNDLDSDSRVIKTAESLQRIRGDVEVICFSSGRTNDIAKSYSFKIRRIVDYNRAGQANTFSKTLAKVWTFGKFCFLTARIAKKYRYMHCNDVSGLIVGIASLFANRNLRLIYDSHEYQSKTVGVGFIQSLIISTFERLSVKWLYGFITVGKLISEEYAKKFGVTGSVVMNCPRYRDIERSNRLREILNIPNYSKLLLMQGGLTKGRGIELMLDAYILARPNSLHLVFMGSGLLSERIRLLGTQNEGIHLLPPVPPCEVLDWTSGADYGLLFYEDNCLNHRYCCPNKLFEYLMASLVPIVSSDLIEVNQIISANSIGISCPPTARDLAALLTKIDSGTIMTKNYAEAIEKAKRDYCWEVQEINLLSVYESNL